MMRISTTAQRHTAAGAADLRLGADTTALLESRLSTTAERTVRAVIVGVPAYADALAGPMGTDIESAVQSALGGFLRLISTPVGSDVSTPLARVLEGAYELGRREARGGRTMDALLAAYRVGARESWRQFSRTAIETKVPSETMAKFAELVFAYIDELSAACAAGHADELATTGRVRARYRHGLTVSLLRGDDPESLRQRAERASWEPPQTLAAVLLPTGQAPHAMVSLDDRTLRADEDLPELDDQERLETTVLLVADASGPRRPAIAAALRSQGAYLGPAKPWTEARISYLRALRARRLALPSSGPVCDTEQHLATLVVAADPTALADLRAQVLAPLAALRGPAVDRLTETLREWLVRRGRRDEIAAALHVHPQTVRYRMSQLRELYGEGLDDPQVLTALTVALTGPADAVHPRPQPERTGGGT